MKRTQIALIALIPAFALGYSACVGGPGTEDEETTAEGEAAMIAPDPALIGTYRNEVIRIDSLYLLVLMKDGTYHRGMTAECTRAPCSVEDDGYYRLWLQDKETYISLYPYRTTGVADEYRYVLAYITQRANDPNGAVALYQDALTVDLGLYPAHSRIADIYEGARMWPQAIEARRHAINANPDDAGLHLGLGVTLAKAGRLAEAEGALAHALELNPRESRAAYYLGIVRQQQGKSAEARSTFERFIALAPSRYARQIDDATQRLAALR